MDYSKTQHDVKQSPELAMRQATAFQHFAPQEDLGSWWEARKVLAAEVQRQLNGADRGG